MVLGLGSVFAAKKGAPIATRLDPGLDSKGVYSIPLDCIVGVHQIPGQQTYLEVINRAAPQAGTTVLKFSQMPIVQNNDGSEEFLDRAVPAGSLDSTGQNIVKVLGYLNDYRGRQTYDRHDLGAVFAVDPKKANSDNLAPYAIALRNPDKVEEMSVAEFWKERDDLAAIGFQAVPVEVPKKIYGRVRGGPA